MQISASFLTDITQSLDQLTSSEQSMTNQLSSGTSVNALSDNPVAAAENVHLSALIEQDVSYQQAALNITSVLQVQDSALGSVESQLTRAISVATQGSNGTQNPTDMSVVSTELSGIRDEILSLANTTFGGNYLFAGSRGASAPFSLKASSVSTQPASVSYLGDTSTSYLQASNGSKIPITSDGSAIFLNTSTGGTNILNTLNLLISAFQNGDSADATALTTALGGSVNFVSTQRTVIDGAISSLAAEQNSAQSQVTQLTAQQSNLMGTDTAKVATELSSTETQQTGLEDAIAALEKQGSLFNLIAS